MPEVPIIENIHQKILEYSQGENHLDMSEWHKNEKIENELHCGTTHCRAGTIIFLAGKKGRELELHTNTPFAAYQIYKKSSSIKVSPPRFYENNETAMADIKRCAKEEVELNNRKVD